MRRRAAYIAYAYGSLKSWYADREIVPYLSAAAPGPQEQRVSPQTQSAISNPSILAYLWLALESNCSILVCGDDTDANKMLLGMIVSLIPDGESIAIIEKDFESINSENLPFNIHSLYGKKYGVSIAQSMDNAIKADTDWIVVDEICRSEADTLLSSADRGSSFVSTVTGSAIGQGLVTRLMSKHTSVDPGSLRGLDVSVLIDSKKNTLSLCEYSWLSRGEVEDGIDISGKDLLGLKEISAISSESLLSSKIVKRYSEMTGFSMDQSIQKIDAKSRELASQPKSPTR